MKISYGKVAVVFLLLTVAALVYVDIRQAQIIQEQRMVILEMYHFIKAGCPFDQLH